MSPLSNSSPAPLRLQTRTILSITKQRHRQLRCHRARNNRNIDPVQPAKCARKLRLVILINQQRGIKHQPLHDRLAACSLDIAELDYARCQRAGGGLGVDATGAVDGFQREGAGGGGPGAARPSRRVSGRRREQQRSKAAGEPDEALVGQGAVGPQRLGGGDEAGDNVGEVVELGC